MRSMIDRDSTASRNRMAADSIKDSEDSMEQELTALEELFMAAAAGILDRCKSHKTGLLFSGGIDSTLIAMALKRFGAEFTCYCVGLEGIGEKEAEDIMMSKEIAQSLGLSLKTVTISPDHVEKNLKRIMELIGDRSAVHAGVGIVLDAACKAAAEGGCDVIITGTGSDEIFAGYHSHRICSDINKECRTRLEAMHSKDLVRDSAIASHHRLSMAAPFLDEKIVEFALSLDPKMKIDTKTGEQKIILRRLAMNMGLDKRFTMRKKKAAQYGSRVHKAIEKLARQNKKSIKQFLEDL